MTARAARYLFRFNPRHIAVLVVTLSVSIIASDLSLENAHPMTAGMCLVVAILINGATAGLAQGLIAALVTSSVYLLVIRFPVITDGLTSIDDYFPVFALSLTAIMTGTLSGRLRDRAQAAERTQGELSYLLRISDDLQSANSYEAIAGVLCATISNRAQLDIILGEVRQFHLFRQITEWDVAVERALAGHVHSSAPTPLDRIDPQVIVTLASTVIERCELLQEQAAAVAAIRSEQLKTALLSSLSHDLRTPLAAIAASASSLRHYGEMLDSQSRADMLDTIQEQCDRLESFTGKLLSLGRLEAGLTRDEAEVVDIEDVLGSALASIGRAQPGRAIHCRVEDGPLLTLANPLLLEQVLCNLLENAARYSDAGDAIDVVLGRDGAMVVLTITDKGVGIAPVDLPRIFERFFRGGNVAGRQGHGLGLSIAKTFVEATGGTISARSPTSAGAGTQIRISLPHVASKVDEAIDA